MARIAFVVPTFHPTRFSGGIACIMQYAAGLAERGHQVMVVPMLPSLEPRWCRGGYRVLAQDPATFRWRHRRAALKAALLAAASPLSRGLRTRRGEARTAADILALRASAGRLPYAIRRAVSLEHLREALPEADVTVATFYETALAVALFGTGRRCYFMQHFEPYFREESTDPHLAELDARASYRLGLRMIANSPWLQARVREAAPGGETHLCSNAVDLKVFNGEPKVARRADEVVVLSFGGRGIAWKGFKEMAEAVRLVRQRLPATRVRWQVYGGAALPADNPIAAYEDLGFLQPGLLAEAYRRADLLLSASWYESFPLFPIEAMACGLAAITTAPGTEAYAIAGETAEVVLPRDPESVAAGLQRLIVDLDYRTALAARGHAMSQRFTWARSVETLEGILLAPGPVA